MAKKKAKNPHAVALGRLGGRKGGKVRFSKLTPEQRSELGRKAVLARWAKQRKSKSSASVIRPDKEGA
ncbi:MAG: hypothetical protein DMG72_25070 [Acidobacteria bacterium]|nr:MAG: hypothetical protein DMG72_25070 [Acidobacteriota bacterium]